MSRTRNEPTSAGSTGTGARRRQGTTRRRGQGTTGRRREGTTRLLSIGAVLGLLLGIAAVILVADQGTKAWALGSLQELQPRPFIGQLVQFTLLFNSGAAWGMGSGSTPIITCLQIAIAIGVVVWAVRSVRTPGYAVALGLVLGGALGNIHDRLLRAPGPFRGEVVDFIQLPYWPVFNVADMAVVSGALLIILLGVIGRPIGDERRDGEERPAGDARHEGSASRRGDSVLGSDASEGRDASRGSDASEGRAQHRQGVSPPALTSAVGES